MMNPRYGCLILLLLFSCVLQAEGDKHLGVASCASSVCHGRVEASEIHGALMTEYSTWFRLDRHSQAFATLKTDLSKRIASNLGLADAASSGICLDCHADNVVKEQQGEDFHLSDGVGCENCHGAAEHWIAGHYGDDASYQASVSRGMKDLANPYTRAEVCLDCHLGNSNQLATHRIMAAGHPRLRFDLSTYEAIMPAHHIVDDDYRDRKPVKTLAGQFAAGVVVTSERYLALVLSDAMNATGPFPEFALFDCFSCHQPIPEGKAAGYPKGGGRSLGMPTFMTANFYLLDRLLVANESSILDDYRTTLKKFLPRHGLKQREHKTAGKELLTLIKQARAEFEDRFQSEELELLAQLLALDSVTNFADYISAEQLFMSLDVLTRALNSEDFPVEALDPLYETFQGAWRFDETAYAAELKRLLKQLKTLEVQQ